MKAKYDFIPSYLRKVTIIGVGRMENGIKAENIQTPISHIFLYKTTAYKFYRRDNDGFNKSFVNLADEAIRAKFYEEDFFYNHLD